MKKACCTFQALCWLAFLSLLVAATPASLVAQRTITTVAGGTVFDGSLATSSSLAFPISVAVDSAGNIHIADHDNHRVRKIAAATGIISTFAGTGFPGFSGDGGPASSAQIGFPHGVAVETADMVTRQQVEPGRVYAIQAHGRLYLLRVERIQGVREALAQRLPPPLDTPQLADGEGRNGKFASRARREPLVTVELQWLAR